MIQRLDQHHDLWKISIFYALQSFETSWNDITKVKIINCFWKATISKQNQTDVAADKDNSFKALQEDFSELQQYNPNYSLKNQQLRILITLIQML